MVTKGMGNMYLPFLTQVPGLLERENWCHLISYSLCFTEPETHKLCHAYLNEWMTYRDPCIFLSHDSATKQHTTFMRIWLKETLSVCGDSWGQNNRSYLWKGPIFAWRFWCLPYPNGLVLKDKHRRPFGTRCTHSDTSECPSKQKCSFIQSLHFYGSFAKMVLGTEKSSGDQDNLPSLVSYWGGNNSNS